MSPAGVQADVRNSSRFYMLTPKDSLGRERHVRQVSLQLFLRDKVNETLARLFFDA